MQKLSKFFRFGVFSGVKLAIAFFVCWVGIGMFSLQAAPDPILYAAYRGGVYGSLLVLLIATPLCYRSHLRNSTL